MEAQVFVKIEEYKDVLKEIDMIKGKIVNAKKLIDDINHLRNEEDAELELWEANLEEIERRVTFMDQALFEPEN